MGVYTERPLEMAIVLNTPFSIFRTLNKPSLTNKNYFPEEELEKIYSPIHSGNEKRMNNSINVVVLIMESFAREYVGALNKDFDNGNYEGYTPFLDSLIQVSKTYNRAFANGRNSIDALPAIVASIPAISEVHHYVTSKYASNEINSLATILEKYGYETAFFYGGPNGSMGYESFMNVAGYNLYIGMNEYGNNDDYDGNWGIWDEKFLLFMADKLNKFKKPFHAVFLGVSSHHPFKVPEKYKGKFKKGTNDFHIPVQYSDLALKRFFEAASKMPWFNNTLFVLTADHSNHATYPEYRNAYGDYAIPIIYYMPSDENMKGFDATVTQHADIMPTILNYLKYDSKFFAFGVDSNDSLSTHFAIISQSGTYQLFYEDFLFQFRDEEPIALYNYIEDRLLLNNILDQNHELQENITTFLKAVIQQYNNNMIRDNLTLKE